ncbi:MAG: hypothetical protein HY064_15650 [Bacteroidetes bacterium]|nr:hypothetical protein [Bacteroidota bacterium]
MKKLFIFLIVSLAVESCSDHGNMDDLDWMVGKWSGTDVNGLVFHENWERGDKKSLTGFSCSISPEGDTVLHQPLKIDLVENVPFYFATLPKSKEPVLFKLIESDAHHAIFENKEHDFPKRITYELEKSNTMKVKLEGIEKGHPKIETLEFERDIPGMNTQPGDSLKKDNTQHIIIQ